MTDNPEQLTRDLVRDNAVAQRTKTDRNPKQGAADGFGAR